MFPSGQIGSAQKPRPCAFLYVSTPTAYPQLFGSGDYRILLEIVSIRSESDCLRQVDEGTHRPLGFSMIVGPRTIERVRRKCPLSSHHLGIVPLCDKSCAAAVSKSSVLSKKELTYLPYGL